MSSTDLLNGPYESQPTYNVKNNPTVTELNPPVQITNLTPFFYSILQNQKFLDVILRLKNMARQYYAVGRRHFCSTVNLSSVQCFQGQNITVDLPLTGGNLLNDAIYANYDFVNRTLLMRILPNGVLPTAWSDQVDRATGQVISASVPVGMLTDREKVLYYFIKNADFFTRVLQLLKNSFEVFNNQSFQCYTLVFPEDFYPGNQSERTIRITNDYLRGIYRNYLANPTYIAYTPLPQPIGTTPCIV